MSLVVIAVRNGTTGRYLDALRGSETAAASIGISATRARITVFALSAGDRRDRRRAARDVRPGGQLRRELRRRSTACSGSCSSSRSARRTVEGAIQAAIGFFVFQAVILNGVLPWTVNHVQPWYHMGNPPATLAIILLSLGAFTYAKHPEGILEFNKRDRSTFATTPDRPDEPVDDTPDECRSRRRATSTDVAAPRAGGSTT